MGREINAVSVKELSNSIPGITEIFGSIARSITSASTIDDADNTSVAFCSKPDDVAVQTIRSSGAGVIICSSTLSFLPEDYRDKTLILVPNPRLAFIQVLQAHFVKNRDSGIHPTAALGSDVEIGQNVYIGPYTSISGNCTIGDNTTICGNVFIYADVNIGSNVSIDAGAVIGADGFSFERDEKGKLIKFPHLGGITIEDDVEIGANTCIDRGTLENTTIGRGTKINNLSHIAHNVSIGGDCIVGGHCYLAGSSRLGANSYLAPGVIIRDGVHIGENVTIGMGSVVTKNIESGLTVFGIPAKPVQ